ncbi:MAG TPA: DUF3048 domain-containing protein [Streptosporangiaceae bacterium]|jgi:hypothetical protein
MNRRLVAAIGLAGVSAVIAAGCSSGGKQAQSAAPSSAPPSKTAKPERTTNPFTGMKRGVHNPVLIAKIDNTHSAHPQAGLRKADIVYVEQVEGGVTRVMAVFSSQLPSRIGPVRSARISDLHIVPQFGHPAFAYSGAQGKLKPDIAKAPLYDVSPDRAGGAYSRDGGRPAPYNLFASPKQLLAKAPKASKARDIGFTFGAPPAGGKKRSSYSVRYPGAKFGFHWSGKAGKWLVSQDGAADSAAEGGQLGAPTIVVQWVDVTRSRFHDFLGNYTPLIHSTGKGTAVVLRDGKAYNAKWSRPGETKGTTFTTASGKPMDFHPGQVWVLLAAKHPRVP